MVSFCFRYVLFMPWYFWQMMASLPELQSCAIGTSLNEKCKRTIDVMKDVSDFDDEKRMTSLLCQSYFIPTWNC